MKKTLLFTLGTIGTLAVSLSTLAFNKNFARYSAAQETSGMFTFSADENAPTQSRVPYEITSSIGTVGTAECYATPNWHSYADFNSYSVASFAFTETYGSASFFVNVRGIHLVSWAFNKNITFDVELTLADGTTFSDDALYHLSGMNGEIDAYSFHLEKPVISIAFLFNGEVSEFSISGLFVYYEVEDCLDAITNYSVE